MLDHFGLAIPTSYEGVSRAAGAPTIDLDINGDGSVFGDGTGMFENDDVVAFISLWLTVGTAQNPNPADFNFDGIVDIEDWAVLNSANPSMGETLRTWILSRNAVPEPSAILLSATAILLFSCQRRTR